MTKTKKRKKDKSALFALFDVIVTICSYFLAYFITNLFNRQYFQFRNEYIIMLLLIIPTWAILLQTMNLTQVPRTRAYASIFINFVNFNSVGFAFLFLYKHIFSLTSFSHYIIISFSIINLFSLYGFRLLTYKVFKYFRANGHNISNIIIYADDESHSFIDTILEHKEWGFRILMIISDSLMIRKKYGETIRIYPDKISINNMLDIDIIDEVIYCSGAINDEKMHSLIEMCEEIGVTFRLRATPAVQNDTKVHLTHFKDTPFITFKNTPTNSLALTWKSFTEFWISFVIIFLLSD